MPNLVTTVWGGNRKPILVQDYGDGQPIDTRISFTRATEARFFDVDGVLQTAASGVARVNSYVFDGTSWINRGFLVEEARTNIALGSEDVEDNAAENNVTTTANTTVAPDGETTMDSILETTADDVHRVDLDAITISSSSAYVVAYVVKKLNNTFVEIDAVLNGTTPATPSIIFNFDTGAITTAHASNDAEGVIDLSGGLFCIWFGVTGEADTTTLQPRVWANTDGTTQQSYVGNTSNGVIVWGKDVEKGPFPTSYIPTVGSSVTRNTDKPFILTADIPGWVDGGPITVLVESFVPIITSQNSYPIFFDDGSNNNRIQFNSPASDKQTWYATINSTGGTNDVVIDSVGTNWVDGVARKTAIALATNDAEVVQDGVSTGTDTSADIPTGLTHFRIGTNFIGVAYNGYIKSHQIFMGRLPSGTMTYETGDH